MTDLAVVRATQRAELAALAMRFFGPGREADAEWLGEQVEILLHRCRESGTGMLFVPGVPAEYCEKLRDQMREHSETMLETAMFAVQTSVMFALTAYRGRKKAAEGG